MKVSDELYVLELPMNWGGVERILNVSLIVDKEHGLTLVDTGLPGQVDLIEAALVKDGFSLSEIKQIVLTHQDVDHVGSLHALKDRTGATIYADAIEVPYIEGTLRSVKYPSPERLAQMPEFAAMLKALQGTHVDEAVEHGHVLTKSGGAVVIATPGHTLGHMSLYLPSTKTLIAGDAVVSNSGTQSGPMEQSYTPIWKPRCTSGKAAGRARYRNHRVLPRRVGHGGRSSSAQKPIDGRMIIIQLRPRSRLER